MFYLSTDIFTYDYINNPDIEIAHRSGIDPGLIDLIAVIVLVALVVINLFKRKLSFGGYIVMILTMIGPWVLLRSVFPFNCYGIWTQVYKWELIPFFGMFKRFMIGIPYHTAIVYWNVAKVTIRFFLPYLICPMTMSLGMNLLSEKNKISFPYIFSIFACIFSLLTTWFDGSALGGDIGIFILSILGVYLGTVIAKALSKFIKSGLFRKEEQIF